MALSRSGTRQNLNANEARQGRLGRDVFWMLLISTLMAFIALAAIWAWNTGGLAATEPTGADQAAAARTFDAPAP